MGNLKQTHGRHSRKHCTARKTHRGSAIFRTFIACVTAFTLMMPVTATTAIASDETGFDPETVGAPATDVIDNGAGAGEGEAAGEAVGVEADGEGVSDVEGETVDAENVDAESVDEEGADGEGVGSDADNSGEEEADGTDAAKDEEKAEGADVTNDGEEADGTDAAKDGEEVEGTDAAKDDKEKADGTDAAKDGENADNKDADDKDGKDADAENKDGKDAKDENAKDDQNADDAAAEKTPETVESKGSVSDEAEDADVAAADKKDADKKDVDKKDADEKDDEAEKMPAQTFEASLNTENGASLTVHVKAPKDAFPIDTTMKVTSVQSADVPEAVEEAVSARTDDAVVDMQAVDISFKDKDGNEIEPAKKVTVTFTSDLISKDDEPMLVHVDDEGEANVLDPLSDKELKNRGVEANENELLVDSDEFSLYVLTLTGKLTADVLTADGATYKVTVTCDEDAQIPEDATLSVTEILPGTDEYQNYLDQAAEALGQENSEDVPFARFFDIEIHNAAGEKIEPAAPVQVKIELADAPEAEQSPLQVVHFEGDEETPVVVETKADEEVDVCFEAESFSTYAILITAVTPPNSGTGQVSGLDGLSFTISRGEGSRERYVTSGLNDGFIGKTYNQSEAAVWTFELMSEEHGPVYSISYTNPDGTTSYLGMEPTSNDVAVLTLAPLGPGEEPTGFFVGKMANGTYVIYRYAFFNGQMRRYDFDEDYGDDSRSKGFHGYTHWTSDNPDDYRGNNWVNLNFNNVLNDAEPSLNTRATGTYAVIVKNPEDNTYYSVQEDGSLMQVQFDERTGVVRVALEEPFAWTYRSAHDGLSDDTKNYNENDDHPDWEPYNIRAPYAARDYDGNQLKSGDYFAYLTSEAKSGIDKEIAPNPDEGDQGSPSHNAHKWANGIRYENYHVHGIAWREREDHSGYYINTGNYIGADFTTMKITGQESLENAATIFFGRIDNVPRPTTETNPADNETVTHIDIGIIATGHLKAPLAYGKYYDETGQQILVITPDTDPKIANLELSEQVTLDAEDIMNAKLTAFRYEGDQEVPYDDAFYITGYSANDQTGHSAVQVRMEGSFKVTTLDPYNGWAARSNDDEARRNARLEKENQVFYKVSTTKDITFPLKIYSAVDNPSGIPSESGYYEYTEGKGYLPSKDEEVVSGKTYYTGTQLYGANGKALEVTAPMDVSATFGYWSDGSEEGEPNNECPPLQEDFESVYGPYLSGNPWPDWNRYQYLMNWFNNHQGKNNAQWKKGAIVNNDWDFSYYQNHGEEYPPYIGDSGMDFILDVEGELKDRILAVEIEKVLEDADGKQSIIPAEDIENSFDLYYRAPGDDWIALVATVAGYATSGEELTDLASKQDGYSLREEGIKLTVPGGEENGESSVIYYDYSVVDGMYYVTENKASIDEYFYDVDGQKWKYKTTRMETEYVWRNDGYDEDPGVHIASNSYSSVPEVLGLYDFEGWEQVSTDEETGEPKQPRNGFLEFHVYNVYDVVKYPVFLKKVASDDLGLTLAGATYDIYGPYDEEPDNPKQDEKLFGSFTTGEDGTAKVADFTKPGLYYLYEAEAPIGYKVAEDPIVLTVTVKNDGVEGKSVISVEKGDNVSGDVTATKDKDGNIVSYEFTVTDEPLLVDIAVSKAWDDADDQDGMRTPSVTVTLLANGEPVADVEPLVLNRGNKWQGLWTGLHEYKDGKKIDYTVQEDEVAGYTPVVESSEKEGVVSLVVTNVHTPETKTFEGSKTWSDADNQDGKRPESITVRLHADGVEVASATVGEQDEWKWKFENQPVYRDGRTRIIYTLTEDAVSDYTSTVTGMNVENAYAPGKVSIPVSKVWVDGDDQDGIRPTNVIIKLLADGEETDETLKLTEVGGWTGSFEALDEYKDGKKIVYTIEEVSVAGYESEVSGDATKGFTVTNTYVPETTSVSIKKVWEDNDDANGIRPESITVHLLADGEPLGDPVLLDADNGWAYTWTDLYKYHDHGKTVAYTVEEDPVEGYASEVSGDAAEGFTVTNSINEQAYGDIEITKAVGGASPVETSCVVHLEGTTPAGEKYESYAEIAYGGSGIGSVTVKHIPAGTKLTITEEYSGAGYDRDTATLTATIKGGETVTPDDGGMFVNLPNGGIPQGNGIQNNFELMENGDWEFTASPSGNQE